MRRNGPWSDDQIQRFLDDTRIPLKVACNGATGFPLMASLWFSAEGGKFWCATQRGASIVSRLAHDPRCAFEVSVEAPPYCGVRGTGLASLHDESGEDVLRTLIERYLGDATSKLARLLLERVDHETAIAIEPRTLISWDYRERMEDS